jgi:hypothetical protein
VTVTNADHACHVLEMLVLIVIPTCANEPAHASDNVNHARPCKVQEAVAPSVHGEEVLQTRRIKGTGEIGK